MALVCEQCPMAAALDSAEVLLEENRNQHKNPQAALGGIVLTRRSLELVAERLDCPGPELDKGQLDCRLRDVAQGARVYGVGNWDINARLEEVGDLADTRELDKAAGNPGQYL